MEERRDLDDHGDDLPWRFPPPENNNRHPITTSQQSHVASQNLYFNPNQHDYFVENPTLQNPTTQDQLSGRLHYSNYPFEKLLVMEPSTCRCQIPENGLSRPSRSAAPGPPLSEYHPYPIPLNQGQYSFINSLPTSFPLQNHETIDFQSGSFDLQSGFESLKIDGLGLPRPNNLTSQRNLAAATNRYATTNNARPSYSNLSYGFLSDHHHLGSSTNASARYNNFDARARHHRHRPSHSSIEELRGRIVLVAEDEQGCLFLQNKVDDRNPIDIEMILSEVKDDLHELMRHQSASHLIQKLIGVLNEEQLTKLILSVVSSQQRLFRTCDDSTGSHIIQKLLDSSEYPRRQPLTQEQQSLLASALKNITVSLSKSPHGNHVIKRCLQAFPSECTKDLMEEIAENCLDLATDRSGCCLLQYCLPLAQEEEKARLIADVVANAYVLSEHSYGNYVVQYILELKIPQATADVVAQLMGRYFALSLGKCSSNVVQKCLLESGEEQSTGIINEIIRHPEIVQLMLDPYGNYVIQTAWDVSQGRRIRQTLYDLVVDNSPFLQSHIYGKNVLAKVRGNKNRFRNRLAMW